MQKSCMQGLEGLRVVSLYLANITAVHDFSLKIVKGFLKVSSDILQIEYISAANINNLEKSLLFSLYVYLC